MQRRFFASIFTLTALMIFLLYGTIKIQWHQSPQSPSWMDISLDLKIPSIHEASGKTSRSLPESLQFQIFRVFGEEKIPSLSKEHPPMMEDAQRVITLQSIWRRLSQLVQVNLPQAAPATDATANQKSLI